MNTLGEWQQSLAWRVQLLYGYSLPVFVFKFGRDRLSPFTRGSQRRRTKQLGAALRQAQEDLRRHGRIHRCDVIAHSFGTLLVTNLLSDDSFDDLEFGRVILTGSIAPRSCPWAQFLRAGRIEAVLNHRAGRDLWVRIAPLAFPDASASGVAGFDCSDCITDVFSAGLGHSDYFVSAQFDSTIEQHWKPFLENRDEGDGGDSPTLRQLPPFTVLKNYFWVGRLLILAIAFPAVWALLRALVILGLLARTLLYVLH